MSQFYACAKVIDDIWQLDASTSESQERGAATVSGATFHNVSWLAWKCSHLMPLVDTLVQVHNIKG